MGWVGLDFVTGSEHVLDRGNSAVLTTLKNEGMIRAATQALRSSHRTWVHPQPENAFGGLASAKPEEERGGQKCMSWKRQMLPVTENQGGREAAVLPGSRGEGWGS